jgi:hypothetical protein
MLNWAADGRDTPHFLDHAIPEPVIRAMEFHGVEVRYGPPKGLTLDLAKDTVISFPWYMDRMKKALENIGKTRWKYDELNHKVYYYRPIGVGFFTNGLHSGAVGIQNKVVPMDHPHHALLLALGEVLHRHGLSL